MYVFNMGHFYGICWSVTIFSHIQITVFNVGPLAFGHKMSAISSANCKERRWKFQLLWNIPHSQFQSVTWNREGFRRFRRYCNSTLDSVKFYVGSIIAFSAKLCVQNVLNSQCALSVNCDVTASLEGYSLSEWIKGRAVSWYQTVTILRIVDGEREPIPRNLRRAVKSLDSRCAVVYNHIFRFYILTYKVTANVGSQSIHTSIPVVSKCTCKCRRLINWQSKQNFIYKQQAATCFGYTQPLSCWIQNHK